MEVRKSPMDHRRPLPPHVLIFPLPLQGPVTSFLKLAELLSLSDVHVTFLLTDHIHSRLLRYTNIQSYYTRYPGFRFQTISDGLPADHPRDQFLELFDSVKTKTKPIFRDLLVSGDLSSDERRPVTCIIADGILSFTLEIGDEIGVPVIYSRTISACCLWVFFCIPKLIESGEFPFKGNDLDELITSVPGMEHFLRRRDLPSFCRSGDPNNPLINLYKTERQETTRSHGLILNTFEDLEGPILSQIRTLSPNLYTIGPLHAHLKTRLPPAPDTTTSSSPSNSLWEEDKSCIQWLDKQNPKSVIYVSFGSLAMMTTDQLIEIWYGLSNSRKKFLWVIRPDSVAGDGEIPVELTEATKERGYVVEWAPQEEVLRHVAIGGFLTHSGWNSTLETVYEGVPMICWPYFVDQQVNSRFVGSVWNLGVDIKDTCDRTVVEKAVNDLMDVRKEEFGRSADRMAELARLSIGEGGSSSASLDRLIEDIRSMSS